MRTQILEIIEQSGKIDDRTLQDCIRMERETGQSLDKIIQRRGLLTEEAFNELYGKSTGISFIELLKDVSVPEVFIDRVPQQFARNYTLVGIESDGSTIKVATCNPLDVYPLDDLASILDLEVEPVLAPRSEITTLINRAYRDKADVVDEVIDDLEDPDYDEIASMVSDSEDLLNVANRAPIIRLVNMILFQALKMRASDVHIQPYEDKVQIRYRIDGVLYDMESPPKSVHEAIVSRVKVMAKMDIAERRIPQDGRASIKIGDSEVDVRISSVPTNYGERIVMRILDKSQGIFNLDQLGLNKDQRELMDQVVQLSHGVIFVTGPTGSGKSTTLYSILNQINSQDKNVITIEDPIEYHLAGISQIQVSNKKGLTFAAGLRSLLRQDPDIMMVGEVRDEETARITIQAALTGHLVFSTLHTNDAASAVSRMLDIGLEPYLVASSLVMIIAQRLVRRVCPDCKELVTPDHAQLRDMTSLGITTSDLPNGKLSLGRGCDMCFNTGYTGRIAIYEMLPIVEDAKELIVERASASKIKIAAQKRGMKTLRQDGITKIIAGTTSVDEILRVTQMDIE
ncbi:MAG: type II secretion system ATPase GspE [Planctomycetota bacterium]